MLCPSSEGCPAGNCLRSHVNRTETAYSLAMITKAGVPANKLIIGMALYGRSFQMTQAGCYGPDCTFTGPESGAAPGRCTGTRGYVSNFEIREIIAEKSSAKQYPDKNGDILVYDDVQWVSWMTREKYDERINWVAALNFGGTSDWAVDLEVSYGDDDGHGGGDSGSGPVYISPDIYETNDPVIGCYPPCTFVFPPWELSTTTTITVPPAAIMYEETWETTLTVSDVTITTSGAKVTSTVITIPPVKTTAIDLWNIVWTKGGKDDDDDKDQTIWLTSSVTFPPVTLTQTSTSGITRPLITWTYSPGPYPSPTVRAPDNPNIPKDPKDPDPTPTPTPPPPPPHGFPPNVRVTSGTPKPTCRPGQIGGQKCQINCNPPDSGCLGICGCIGPFCPDGGSCVGPGCSAAISRGGGGGGRGWGSYELPNEFHRLLLRG
ncbi:putative chitinase [Microsporum audouinii]